jgi:N4-(beta-N-acetylglucosaminyl)-L-asparaginase
MDEFFNCGSVAFLERIKHPVSVARRVMEKTPHCNAGGSGAQQFAIAEGFPLEEQKLSPDAQENYDKWLKKSEYKPMINIENLPDRLKNSPTESFRILWSRQVQKLMDLLPRHNLKMENGITTPLGWWPWIQREI